MSVWSSADMMRFLANVRFTPDTDISRMQVECLLRSN